MRCIADRLQCPTRAGRGAAPQLYISLRPSQWQRKRTNAPHENLTLNFILFPTSIAWPDMHARMQVSLRVMSGAF